MTDRVVPQAAVCTCAESWQNVGPFECPYHGHVEAHLKRLTPYQIADGAVELFLEYRDLHGYDEELARAKAVSDTVEGASVV